MHAPSAMKNAWQAGAGRPQTAEWSGDFARMEQQNREAASRGAEQQMRIQSDGGMHATGQARLFGAGFGGAAPMMMAQPGGMYGMQMEGSPMHQQHQYQQPPQDTVVQTKGELSRPGRALAEADLAPYQRPIGSPLSGSSRHRLFTPNPSPPFSKKLKLPDDQRPPSFRTSKHETLSHAQLAPSSRRCTRQNGSAPMESNR